MACKATLTLIILRTLTWTLTRTLTLASLRTLDPPKPTHPDLNSNPSYPSPNPNPFQSVAP